MQRLDLNNYPEILTVKDIMEILKIGRSKAYELVETQREKIGAFKIGKNYKIIKKVFISWLHAQVS